MKNWYQIKNRSEGVLDISLHDEIGMFGISAAEFIADLRKNPDIKSINLSIHSPGGSVLDGLAIYNSLKGHPAKVFGHVEGIAASAASFVLMAADTISMPEDAFIMIHNAHGGAMGDAEDLREMADIIDKLQGTILNIYEKRTGHDRDALDAMRKAETWLTANEAMEFGFVDTVTDKMEVAAKINIFSRHFKEMPIEDNLSIDNINTITDFERFLRDSGIPKKLATALTSTAKVIFRGEPEETESELTKLVERLDNLKLPELN